MILSIIKHSAPYKMDSPIKSASDGGGLFKNSKQLSPSNRQELGAYTLELYSLSRKAIKQPIT